MLRVVAEIENFRDLLSDALEANLSQVSVRQNDDMRKISAWVAIGAVPTLVGAIYGMNFDHMPELGWRYGYLIVLVAHRHRLRPAVPPLQAIRLALTSATLPSRRLSAVGGRADYESCGAAGGGTGAKWRRASSRGGRLWAPHAAGPPRGGCWPGTLRCCSGWPGWRSPSRSWICSGATPRSSWRGATDGARSWLSRCVVAFVPALVLFVVTAVPGLVDRRVGAWLHSVAVGVLAGLFGLVVGGALGVQSLWPAVVLALLLGVGVALLERRARWARQFLTYLALGNVAFVLLFLLASPTTELLRGASYADAANVKIPPLNGPVLVVVLDEFSLTTLLRPDGTINDERYPNIAALADQSTWFRNAASESSTTYVSTPTILTGVRAEEDSLPFIGDHPRNYFTLFGARYPVNRYELVTDLCPPDVCESDRDQQPLSQALDDASVVYRHRVLPEEWREGLPEIDHSWGGFGDDLADEVEPAETVTVPTLPTGSPDPMAKIKRLPASDEVASVRQGSCCARST